MVHSIELFLFTTLGEDVKVGLEVLLLSVSGISSKNMEFKVDMFLRQFWTDSRLKHDFIQVQYILFFVMIVIIFFSS